MSTAIDLAQLPAPQIIEELSFDNIFNELQQDFVAQHPEFDALLPSDPAYKLLETSAYRELLLRQRINEACKANLIAYATASDLDNLAALFNVKRQLEESDDRFRNRIVLALEGITTAGSEESYIFHAFNASPAVKDVSVISERPCEVDVYILAVDAHKSADQESLRAAVESQLNAQKIRPLTDLVTTHLAKLTSFHIAARLQLKPGPGREQTLVAVKEQLAAYLTDIHKLGESVSYSAIYAALHQTGIAKVELLSRQDAQDYQLPVSPIEDDGHYIQLTDLETPKTTAPYCTPNFSVISADDTSLEVFLIESHLISEDE